MDSRRQGWAIIEELMLRTLDTIEQTRNGTEEAMRRSLEDEDKVGGHEMTMEDISKRSRKLRMATHSGKITDTECTICLVKYDSKSVLRVLQCGHMQHVGCIDKWLKKNGTCIMCRNKVWENDPIKDKIPPALKRTPTWKSKNQFPFESVEERVAEGKPSSSQKNNRNRFCRGKCCFGTSSWGKKPCCLECCHGHFRNEDCGGRSLLWVVVDV